MPTVLLTGATGFLGSHILGALLENDVDVVALKRSSSDMWRIKHLVDRVHFYDVDQVPVEKAFSENPVDTVIHTACQYGRGNESISYVLEGNLLFGVKVLESAIKHNVCTFINTDTFFNSGEIVQDHLNTYTLSKKQFIEWLKMKSNCIHVINLKLEHLYGPKDDVTKFVPWLFAQLKNGENEIRLTEGVQERDFIYVTDVVSAYLIFLSKDINLDSFSEYDVGTGSIVSVRGVVEKAKEVYEKEYGKSNTVLNFGALPMGRGEIMTIKTDNSALLEMGWKPVVTLEKGLLDVLKDMS